MSGDIRGTLTTVFAALADGDGRPFHEVLAADVVWTVPGSGSWSGTYRGREAIRTDLLRPLGARLGLIRSFADRILVDGDWAAVQFHGDNETVDGRRYDNRYVFMLRFEADRIVEIVEYMDTELAHRILGPKPA